MEFLYKLPKDFSSITIDELLNYWLIPRKVRHFLRIRKNILVNDQYVHFQTLVHPCDEIKLIFEENDYQQPKHLAGNAALVNVIFENDHLIIVNKPISMKTHPNDPSECDTLVNHLVAYLAPQKKSPYVVHRLDKETSGCILFAKNPIVLPLLSRQLEQREIKRTYEALCYGKISQKQLTINKKIGRDRHDRRKRLIDLQHGQTAITHVQVVSATQQSSRIICNLDTGGTHQIRVHLASINHPLIGDPLYNKIPDKRLYLHASELSLKDPFTKELIVANTPTPF